MFGRAARRGCCVKRYLLWLLYREFGTQQYGTPKVGRLIHTHSAHLIHFNWKCQSTEHGGFVIKAYNPVYIYQYFPSQGNSSNRWTVLGGIMLTVTGLAAYMMSNTEHVSDVFCHSIPGPPQLEFVILLTNCMLVSYTSKETQLFMVGSIQGPLRRFL